MEDAIQTFNLGIFSFNKAAAEWGFKRTTLQRRLKNQQIGKSGAVRKFSDAEEDSLEEVLMCCGEMGVSILKVLILQAFISL